MLRFHHYTSTSFLSQLIPSSTQLSCSCSSMFHELFIQFSPSHRNTAHSHVTHMSFLTLSLRPHQHPSLRSITLLSTFSTLHSRYVLVSIHHFGPFHSCPSSQLTHASLFFFKSSSASISLVHVTDVHLFLAHLKLPHIIPHMIYHTSPTFHPHSITSTPTKSPSVSPIVHL